MRVGKYLHTEERLEFMNFDYRLRFSEPENP